VSKIRVLEFQGDKKREQAARDSHGVGNLYVEKKLTTKARAQRKARKTHTRVRPFADKECLVREQGSSEMGQWLNMHVSNGNESVVTK